MSGTSANTATGISKGTATSDTPAGRRSARETVLPDLLIPGDPRVCPLWVVELVAVGIALLALLTVQLGADRFSWWRCVIALFVVLPVAWRVLAAPPLALGAYLFVLVTCTLHPGWLLMVGAAGLVGIVLTGNLALTLERSAVLYRSALRRILLRWAWLLGVTEGCALLAWVATGIPKDPLLGGLGVLGIAAAVVAVGYFTFLPGKSRTE